MSAADRQEVQRRLQTLRVNELKTLLRRYHLPVSGRKDFLIHRLVSHAERNNVMVELKDQAQNAYPSYATAYGGYGAAAAAAAAAAPPPMFEMPDDDALDVLPFPNVYGHQHHQPMHMHNNNNNALLATTGAARLPQAVSSDSFHRQKATLYACSVLNARGSTLIELNTQAHPSLFAPGARDRERVLIYSAEVSASAAGKPVKHTWAPAVTVTVNGHAMPVVQQCVDGHTVSKVTLDRPLDILPRLFSSRMNMIRFHLMDCEAIEQRRFAVCIVRAEEVSADEQLRGISDLTREESEQQLHALFSAVQIDDDDDDDDDAAASSSSSSGSKSDSAEPVRISVRDPVTLQLIRTPVRSAQCAHVQCFDAENWLRFQRNAKNAQFACFVCNKKPIGIDQLRVDPWLRDVLEGVRARQPDAEQVEVRNDLSWTPIAPAGKKTSSSSSSSSATDDDGEGLGLGLTPLAGTKRKRAADVAAELADVQEAISLLSDDDE